MSARVLAVAAAWLTWGAATPAGAIEEVVGARALGMGEALRAAATGPTAVYLNPAGMALTRSYMVEASYLLRTHDSVNALSTAVTDSITARVAAGVYYTFLDASPDVGGRSFDRRSHETGLALAYPIGDRLSLGVNGRFVDLRVHADAEGDQPEATLADIDKEINFDVGMAVRLSDALSLGVVGYNLSSDEPVAGEVAEYPRALGLGAALSLGGRLLVDVDTVFDGQSVPDETRLRVAAGGELALSSVALRAGFTRDGVDETSAISGGLGYVTPQVGLDLGVRQELSGEEATTFSIGLRLFVQ